MSEFKERFELQASTLGNYFGRGFIEPLEQLDIDLGNKERFFSRTAEDSMKLGSALENGVLDYFEQRLNIKITNRNTGIITNSKGTIRGKIDGEAIYNGEPTIVECKVSSSDFTKDFGYYLQVQAYMDMKGYNQALLLGLAGGERVYTLIKRDDEIINDINTLADDVISILIGLTDKEDYPMEIVNKYAEDKEVKVLESIDEETVELIKTADSLSKQIKELEKQKTEIIDKLKSYYPDNVSYKKDGISFTVNEQFRAGSIDLELLKENYPEIDLEKFRKQGSSYKVVRASYKVK